MEDLARGQFTFYRSYFEALRDLPDKDRLALYDATCAYALDGTEPDLKGVRRTVFTLIRPTLDVARRKSKGGKTGSPKKKDYEKTNERPSKDPVKEKEGEKEKEIEKEIEIENECYRGEATTCALLAPGSMFTCFWSSYPSTKGGREAAFQEWKNLAPSAETANTILQSLETFKRCMQWTKDDGNFIPSAAKFLRERYFEKPPVLTGARDIPKGASGTLGEAEMEAIRNVLSQEGGTYGT